MRNDFENRLATLKVVPPTDQYESRSLWLISEARLRRTGRPSKWALIAMLMLSLATNIYFFAASSERADVGSSHSDGARQSQRQIQFMSIPGVKDLPQVTIMELKQ